MNKIKIDCALIFALEEEFSILENVIGFRKIDRYYEFSFLDKKGIHRNCIACYVNYPGSHEAYKYLKEFHEIYEPFIQFAIGISGQLSSDLKIGDIVVASSIDKYDYDSKQKNGLVVSGRTINLEFEKESFIHLNKQKQNSIQNWQLTAAKNFDIKFTKNQTFELRQQGFVRPNSQPIFKYGKIATGESVIDDQIAKGEIQKKDRKLLCVDMESFGFADACSSSIPLVMIRAISDTADGKKKMLDNFSESPDLIRKWALQNAFNFLDQVLFKTFDFPLNNHFNNSSELTTKELIDRITNNKEDAYIKYASLFNHLVFREKNGRVGNSIYEYLNNELTLTEQGTPIIVNGLPGTGKTTLLYSFFKYLNKDEHQCNYVNLHDYKSIFSDEVQQIFSSDISKLANDINTKYLIIDGVDQFERFFINKEIKIDSLWGHISKTYKGIILGMTLQDYENEEDEIRHYYLPEPKCKIELQNFLFTESNLNDLIADLLFVNDLEQTEDRKEIITRFILGIGQKEIDWHTINLIVKKIWRHNYSKISSIGKFFFNYAQDFFSNSSIDSPIPLASNLTFKKFIKEEKLTALEYNSLLWQFIQKSNTIKQFLIAEHLIEKYCNLREDFESSVEDLKHIYSYKINSYFKDNINRNVKVQSRIFESITSKYDQLTIQQQPNICYILGRLDNPQLHASAKSFLNRKLSMELEHYANGKYNWDEDSFRQHLLLIRTMFISLVYLHDKNASKDYLKFLLSNQEWDDLNRGFHLEYYGDKPYDPLKLGLHNDDLSISFSKTFERLYSKIKKVIANPRNENNSMVDIELQTITSLAINRHLIGKLDSTIQLKLKEMLTIFKQNESQLIRNQDLKPFINFALYILVKDEASSFDIINDLYNIKKITRSGWNFEGSFRGNAIKRSVENCESVADHTYGALTIATFLLPEFDINDKEYKKSDVLKTIFIHDLAEAYTGDVVNFLKTEAEKKDEDEKMKLIFSLQILKGFGNLEEYKLLWENYKSQTTIAAKLTREIDKIDNLIQLIIYQRNENNIISDFDSWKNDLLKEINTPIGKTILNTILA